MRNKFGGDAVKQANGPRGGDPEIEMTVIESQRRHGMGPVGKQKMMIALGIVLLSLMDELGVFDPIRTNRSNVNPPGQEFMV